MNEELVPSLVGEISGIDELFGELSDSGDISGGLSIPATVYERLKPATTSRLGGIIVGDNLLITEEGRLSVDTANDAEGDNTRPITSAAVYTEIGNINVLLAAI